ncbi:MULTISPECIES: hypothetical protein [unclassified Tenacibaculum]|uniref:hypothetical protein n=1 Tax=unclassified Tenacibaculum TaxID=2635139 RepID=UPI001F1FC778|nr:MULTISPECIES: hypothetical protein [unclassified Tenacibaculum]MCF2873234.1 hypothetical protein [Tenacibaculum sp. Cn5-1]MCF2933390.1 hypothetical protein [Tenacibaculum sp. Cn5-34]MCG7510029.1 hypothetical protein [Tenacibaculum sp. Cn5-46]
MIDSKTGNISINNILTLKPNFRFQEIKELKLGEIQETREMGTEWKWIDIKNLKIENEYYLFFLGFKNEKLKLISFNVNTKPFELDSNWNSWTEKQELKKYKYLKKWLNIKVGKDSEFDWGSISTSYDPKGGFSAIKIKYKN